MRSYINKTLSYVVVDAIIVIITVVFIVIVVGVNVPLVWGFFFSFYIVTPVGGDK